MTPPPLASGAPAAALPGPARAALWMTGALAAFSLMAVAGRELAGEANTFQIMFWRSLVGLALVCAALAVAARGFGQIATRRPGLHALRNLAHFFGQNCWFYAVATIPLAQVFAFEFTTPIWVALLGPLLIGERFTLWRGVAALLGFLGVLAVARPGASAFELGQAVALIAALGFAGNVLATKKLSATETVLSIMFWMTASQAVMALLCAGALGWASGRPALPWPTAETGFWFAVAGVCGLSAHFAIANALRAADAAVVAPMDFFRLPLIAGVGALLYAEPLEAAVFLGGALIFLGNFLNIRAETRRRAPAPAAPATKGALDGG